jgi:hypothetical protein
MPRAKVDTSIQRITMEGMQFPLGVYPIEPMAPRQGYRSDFEPADGDDEEGEWEEWPDRYVYEIVVSADRLEPLCRSLFALFPGRVYPILDVLGHDAYREVDPYISYELIGIERFTDAIRRFRGFFYEDGLCGFGTMNDEPFFYVFVDEHKIITVRAATELKEKVEKVLDAYDLAQIDEPLGADAVAHEHRGVLETPEDRPDLLTHEEIVEQLRDDWKLVLNVDAETNVDDDGNDLGTTGWRCLLRLAPPPPDEDTHPAPSRYAEVILTADNLREAEDLAYDAAESLLPDGVEGWDECVLVAADRLTPEQFAEVVLAPPAVADGAAATGTGTSTPAPAGGAGKASGEAAKGEAAETPPAHPPQKPPKPAGDDAEGAIVPRESRIFRATWLE